MNIILKVLEGDRVYVWHTLQEMTDVRWAECSSCIFPHQIFRNVQVREREKERERGWCFLKVLAYSYFNQSKMWLKSLRQIHKLFQVSSVQSSVLFTLFLASLQRFSQDWGPEWIRTGTNFLGKTAPEISHLKISQEDSWESCFVNGFMYGFCQL